MTMEAFHERLSSLEKRVALLESYKYINSPDARYEARYTELSTKYGQHVNKSCAAKIIGVTRATVYAMLKDGRLEGVCYGKHVSIQSIARYLSAGRGEKARRYRRGGSITKEDQHEDCQSGN